MPGLKPRPEDIYPELFFLDPGGWRAWLQANHDSCAGVWLVYYKVHTGLPSLKYVEALREALCFGWIDNKVQKLDEQRYRQIFTPRRPGSIWSKTNKQHVAELIAEGRMAPAGLAKIQAAQVDGSWNRLDASDIMEMPPDLEQALAAQPLAQANFKAFAPSLKKGLYYWVTSAKRPETRARRIERIVLAAAQNKGPMEF